MGDSQKCNTEAPKTANQNKIREYGFLFCFFKGFRSSLIPHWIYNNKNMYERNIINFEAD